MSDLSMYIPTIWGCEVLRDYIRCIWPGLIFRLWRWICLGWISFGTIVSGVVPKYGSHKSWFVCCKIQVLDWVPWKSHSIYYFPSSGVPSCYRFSWQNSEILGLGDLWTDWVNQTRGIRSSHNYLPPWWKNLVLRIGWKPKGLFMFAARV